MAGQEPDRKTEGSKDLGRIVGVVLGAVVLTYLACVLVIPLPKERRLDTAELALLMVAGLVVGILFRPDLLDRLKNVKLFGSEVELIEKLEADTKRQGKELDDIRFILTMLLQPEELHHMQRLKLKQTENYSGGRSVRTQLRKLRDIGLIENMPERAIAELKDGSHNNLAEIVCLTDRGQRYLDRLGESEEN